jgi:hypothetical protein
VQLVDRPCGASGIDDVEGVAALVEVRAHPGAGIGDVGVLVERRDGRVVGRHFTLSVPGSSRSGARWRYGEWQLFVTLEAVRIRFKQSFVMDTIDHLDGL